MQTLNRIKAAKLLKIHPDTLAARAKAGIIPGAKIGRAWVFIAEDLEEWLRSQYRGTRQVAQEGEKLCHYSKEKTRLTGGSKSASQMQEQCRSLLGLQKRRKRKNTTTNSKPNSGDSPG